MIMFDDDDLMVPTVDTVRVMMKEVAHFQPMGRPRVPVSCSSSLKEPVQRLWSLGVALKYIWPYITIVCIFDSADAFYMITPMCSVECIKATFIMVMVV